MTWIPGKPAPKIVRFSRMVRAAHGRKDEVPYLPIDYYLEVTKRCNIRCRTCARLYDPSFREDDGMGDMSLETFRLVEPWLQHALRVNTVGFGEPFLNPHLPLIMERATALGAFVTVITNGTLLTDELIRKLVRIGLGILVVSIDAGTKETFESIRRGARWNTVIESLERLHAAKKAVRSKRPRVHVEFVAMKDNFETLPDLVDLAAERGAASLHIEPLLRGGNAGYQAFYAEQSLANLSLEKARNLLEETRMRAEKNKLRLTGLFIDDGVDPIWHASRIPAQGQVDHPAAGTPAQSIKEISGWCFHPSGDVRIVLVQAGAEIDAVDPDLPRADVEAVLAENFPGRSHCGFKIDLPAEAQNKESPLEVAAMDSAGGRTILARFEAAAPARTSNRQEVEGDPPPPEKTLFTPPRARRGMPYCTEPWTTCFVDFNGKVFPCCAAQGEPLGDLNEESLPDIWNGERFRRLRRAIAQSKVPGLCTNCVANQRTVIKSVWRQFLPLVWSS